MMTMEVGYNQAIVSNLNFLKKIKINFNNNDNNSNQQKIQENSNSFGGFMEISNCHNGNDIVENI